MTSMSVKSDGVTKASDAFWHVMDREVGTRDATRTVGWNGADQHGPLGLAGEKASELQGTFVAANAGLCRGCTRDKVAMYIRNIVTEAKRRGGDCLKNAMATLTVMCFQLRDCRGGKGEKDLARWMLMELYLLYPKSVIALMSLVPEYGYWKDISLLIENCLDTDAEKYKPLIEQCYDEIIKQLREDRAIYDDYMQNKGKPGCPPSPKISLAAKWCMKEKRKYDKKFGGAHQMAKRMFPEAYGEDKFKGMALYRKFYAPLQKAIKTTETLMSTDRWDEIEFVLVPGKLLNLCRRAFLNLKGGSKCRLEDERSSDPKRRACREALLRHFERVEKGETKMKGAKSLDLYEIAGKFLSSRVSPDEKRLLQLQWNAHREEIQEKIREEGLAADRIVCMADMSGSMAGKPLENAVSLSIMFSELQPAPYGSKFMSFAEEPRWIQFEEGWDLEQKVRHAQSSSWGMTTDFLKAHDLILAAAIKHRLQPEQLPKKFVVISDMQFNQAAKSCGTNSYPTLDAHADAILLNSVRGTRSNSYSSSYSTKTQNFQTHHEILKEAYRKAGIAACGTPYVLPETVYWNVNGATTGFPVQADTPNTQMVSGFNRSLIPVILGEAVPDEFEEPKPPTPWDTFVRTMDDERYDPVLRTLERVGEKEFASYHAPIREGDEEESKDEERDDSNDFLWTVGTRVNATDHRGKDYDGEVVELEEERIRVHFDKFSAKWDEWYNVGSEKVRKLDISPSVTATPPVAPGKGPCTSCENWTSEELRNWLDSKYTLGESSLEKVISEDVNGACFDIICQGQDRESLVELGISSRLLQTKIFRDWGTEKA